MTMDLLAVIGAQALWLTYLWLASAIVASYLSARKGYGEKLGLAFGLLLSVVGALIWLIWPAKPDSRWKLQGLVRQRRQDGRRAARRAARGARATRAGWSLCAARPRAPAAGIS